MRTLKLTIEVTDTELTADQAQQLCLLALTERNFGVQAVMVERREETERDVNEMIEELKRGDEAVR